MTNHDEIETTTREAHPHSPGFGVSHKFPGSDTREHSTNEVETAEAVGTGETTTSDETSKGDE